MNPLTVYDDRYIKTKIRIYGDKAYTYFRNLSVPQNGVECEFFTIISIDSLLVYDSKCYLQVYLDNCAYKIVNTQMVHYLGDNYFKSDLFFDFDE